MHKKEPKGEYAGPYKLMETLGKGGLATVKIGIEMDSGARVAVKIINKERVANPREQVSMAREITVMKLLKHKNILRLYDIYENEEKIFLILDLFEGGDLYGYLTQKGAMPPNEALHLFKQIISGVEYCHKNMIVHRDLKPENLLLSADRKSLVISDFGLSTGMQGARKLLKTRCGTVHYISPEVAKGDLYVGMASDIWSCGIVLFAMVTASLPFDAPTSVAVLKKIVRGEYVIPQHLPKELKDLISLMLTLDPKERITIPQLKAHPWYLGLPDDTPRQHVEEEQPEPYILSLRDLQDNFHVMGNLKLLGWDEGQLMNDLLSQDMNMAKVFYRLLIEHENVALEEPEPPPPVVDPMEKKFRRLSVGSPTRSNSKRIGTVDVKGGVSPLKRRTTEQRNSPHRSVRSSERPITRHNRNASADRPESRERSATTGDEESAAAAAVIIAARQAAGRTPVERRKSEREHLVARRGRAESAATRVSRDSSSRDKTPSRDTGSPAPEEIIIPITPEKLTTETIPVTPPSEFTTPIKNSPSTTMTPEKGKNVMWGISPTLAPEASKFQVDSNKNVTQLLESLKNCFGELGQYDISAKQTKTGYKVKARKSGKRKGRAEVTVNLFQKEDGDTELVFKGSGGKSKQFQELAKKMEETLVV